MNRFFLFTMKLKGIDKFREKVPILNEKRIIILPISALAVIILFIMTISYVYRLPNPSSTISVISPLLGIGITISFSANKDILLKVNDNWTQPSE